MPRELFLVPMEGTGTVADPFRGKYTRHADVSAFGCIRYSRDTVAVCMLDAPQVSLDSIAAQPDADRLVSELDLNENIGGQDVVATRNLLESLDIPGDWVSANDSWRETVRGIVGMFLFTQRHEGLNQSGFFTDLAAAGFGLNTQWMDLSQSFRDTIQATIDDHNWSITPTNNDQIRKLLKDFSDKFSSIEIFVGNLQI